MITTLTLKNFRRYKKARFTFTPGLNVICGKNWAGKTTLISAITYALFGTKATPGTAANLVTYGETDMQVVLDFVIDGTHYQLTRGPKKALLSDFSLEATIATGQSQVTEAVEKIIGSATKDFVDFNVTRQEEAASLLTLSSAKLSEYVSRITGIDTVDAVLKRLSTERSKSEGALAVYSDETAQVEKLKADLEQYQGVHSRLSAELAQIGVKKRYLEDSYKVCSSHHDTLQAQYDACENSKRSLAVAKGIYDNAVQQHKEAKSNLPKKAPKENLEELKTIVTFSKEVLDRADQAEQTRERLSKEIAEADASIASYDATLSHLTVTDLTGMQQALVDEQLRCEGLLKDLQDANIRSEQSMCPYCMRAFENFDPEELSKKAQECEKTYDEAEAKRQEMIDAFSKLVEANDEHTRLTDYKGQWQRYKDERVAELQELPDIVNREYLAATLKTALSDLQLASDEHTAYQAYKTDVDRWASEMSRTKKALDSVEVTPGPTSSDVNKAARAAKQAKSEVDAAYHEYSKVERDLQPIAQWITSIAREMEVVKEREERRAGVVRRHAQIVELSKFLRQNRDQFTHSVWDQLLGFSSNFVREATSGDVSEISRSGDGDFLYVENGNAMPINGNASGMQKAIFATSIKLALAKALGSKFDVLFFDEVTAAAGDDTSLLFTSLLTKTCSQSFLVTHRSADAAVAEQLIEIDAQRH